MIRINLLGTPRQKKGKRGGSAAPVSMPSEGPSPILVLLIVFALAAGANYWYYRSLNAKHVKLQAEMLGCLAHLTSEFLGAGRVVRIDEQCQIGCGRQ